MQHLVNLLAEFNSFGSPWCKDAHEKLTGQIKWCQSCCIEVGVTRGNIHENNLEVGAS